MVESLNSRGAQARACSAGPHPPCPPSCPRPRPYGSAPLDGDEPLQLAGTGGEVGVDLWGAGGSKGCFESTPTAGVTHTKPAVG